MNSFCTGISLYNPKYLDFEKDEILYIHDTDGTLEDFASEYLGELNITFIITRTQSDPIKGEVHGKNLRFIKLSTSPEGVDVSLLCCAGLFCHQ